MNQYNSIKPIALAPVCLSSYITDKQNGLRLDKAIASLFPTYSRSCLTQWIREGQVQVNGHTERKVRYKVQSGQYILIQATLKRQNHWGEQAGLPLTILHEDEALLIINKPAGLVVHPGNGHPDKTLVNALLHHDSSLAHLPRGGLIHRLDKDTTGLLVVARTLQAYQYLTDQLQSHAIERVYEAIVHGVVITGGTIDAPMKRHHQQRTRMTVVRENKRHQDQSGRTAVTHYRVLTQYQYHTHLQLQLQTGRTHQIRVHMCFINHPLVGDPTYGRKRTAPQTLSTDLRKRLDTFPRQALHAKRLALTHPLTKTVCQWSAPLPDDMAALIQALDCTKGTP